MQTSRVASLLLFVQPIAVAAQCRLCAPRPAGPVASPAPVAKPIEVEIETALDFSRVAQVTGRGGRVVIDPATGARRVEGALTDLGGGTLRGQVHVTGEPMRPIRVILPQRITLASADGSSVEVTNIKTDLPADARLGAGGTLTFGFGGQLDVGAAAVGSYHGRIPISVEYQ